MDASVTVFRSFSKIINGSGVGTVYTVPAEHFAIIFVSKERSSLINHNGVDDPTINFQSLTLTIGGTLRQSTSTSKRSSVYESSNHVDGCTLSAAASSGESIAIGHSGDGAVKYQILEFLNGTHG